MTQVRTPIRMVFKGPIVDETGVARDKRSYLYFALHRPDLVGAKVAATRWLLENLATSRRIEVREYMAGIGVQSRVISEFFPNRKHRVSDLNRGCVDYLSACGFDATQEDALVSMLAPDTSDLKLVDFPASSVLHLKRKWARQFDALFAPGPAAVVWTDTAITYPMAVHGKRYAAATGVEEITSPEAYARAVSHWLFKRHSYSITRAAIRGVNAFYFLATPGPGTVEVKRFLLQDHKNLFTAEVVG